MRILLINKYLYPKGGAETYVIKLGKCFSKMGHKVEYFGMYDARNTLTNSAQSYTDNIDFHKKSIRQLFYPLRIIYSIQARWRLRQVIKTFKPDVAHLNNFNYQLTPSIIYELKKFNIPIIYTAHDVQLVCPNHKMKNDATDGLCRKCYGGEYKNCVNNRCIHSSKARSILGALEAYIYKRAHTYRHIDRIICPSGFIEKEILHNLDLAGRTRVMYNFIEDITPYGREKEDYVLYFGRYSVEKGIRTLIKAAKSLPHIKFVFAGRGELEGEINKADNITNLGFLTGRKLNEVIEKALFSVLPSEWSENCPFSVMEAETLLTPVIGAKIGGIPELIEEGKTGLLFESGNEKELAEKISYLYENKELCEMMSENCRRLAYDTVNEYAEKMIDIYKELM